MALTSHVEEYLEAIYRLGGQDRPVHLSALAEHLELSAASVNEMVRRMEGSIWTYVIMLVIGVPVYVCAVASTPVAAGLIVGEALVGVSAALIAVFG